MNEDTTEAQMSPEDLAQHREAAQQRKDTGLEPGRFGIIAPPPQPDRALPDFGTRTFARVDLSTHPLPPGAAPYPPPEVEPEA